MSYFKVEKDLPDDPRVMTAGMAAANAVVAILNGSDEEARCHALCHVTLGVLVTLWRYADTYVLSDNSLPVTLQGLAAKLGCSVDILRALPDCWLRVRADGRVELPGYVVKNRVRGKDLRKTDADRREADRLRQQRHRAKRRQGTDGGPVTQRDTPVTSRGRHAPTGTGTGTYRPIPEPAVATLASALGRLASRPENGHGPASSNAAEPGEGRKRERERKSQATLKSDVRMLTDRGMDPPTIARTLAQHGVTETDINRWLEEPAP